MKITYLLRTVLVIIFLPISSPFFTTSPHILHLTSFDVFISARSSRFPHSLQKLVLKSGASNTCAHVLLLFLCVSSVIAAVFVDFFVVIPLLVVGVVALSLGVVDLSLGAVCFGVALSFSVVLVFGVSSCDFFVDLGVLDDEEEEGELFFVEGVFGVDILLLVMMGKIHAQKAQRCVNSLPNCVNSFTKLCKCFVIDWPNRDAHDTPNSKILF